MVFVLNEYQRVSKFMRGHFASQGYNCKRMYLRNEGFEKDFDRSCVYSFGSYERG